MSVPVSVRPFPRDALVAAAAMVTLAMTAAVLGRVEGAAPLSSGEETVATRDLRFRDQADGGVVVLDLQGRLVAVMAPGTNGFLRATLRGLARERRAEDLGAETPFRLIAWAEGGITRQDMSTGLQVHLQAFGSTKAEVFARLLTERGETP